MIILVLVIVRLWNPDTFVKRTDTTVLSQECWTGAGEYQIPPDSSGDLIRYGRNLIVRTAYYFGPKGSVAHSSNGMNCQNCHLEAGTKPWGNNFGAVAANYPKFRSRSGTVEGIVKRVNDCFERSLNGHAIDSTGKEMKAIIAYLQWLGNDIPKGITPKGSGIKIPPPLIRAADPLKGKTIFLQTCARCHGQQGEGQMQPDGIAYQYPPLWGVHSYNTGAGLYRLSTFAGFVQNNMPNPTNYHHPALNNTDAWDVAAFVNSQPRPVMQVKDDWPDIHKKPFDYPFGPYADSLSEKQHKYGPWTALNLF